MRATTARSSSTASFRGVSSSIYIALACQHNTPSKNLKFIFGDATQGAARGSTTVSRVHQLLPGPAEVTLKGVACCAKQKAMPRKWQFALVKPGASSAVVEPLDYSLVKPGATETAKIETIVEGADDKLAGLKKKRAMEMAMVPGRNLMMTAFMMWMSGAGVHIFSVRFALRTARATTRCGGVCARARHRLTLPGKKITDYDCGNGVGDAHQDVDHGANVLCAAGGRRSQGQLARGQARLHCAQPARPRRRPLQVLHQ